MSPGSSTESYPAFAHIGLRENPGKNLNQVTCPDRESNPGHLVSQPDALTVTPQFVQKDSNGKGSFNRSSVCLPLKKELRKRLVKCFVWSVSFYGAETWTLRRSEEKRLETFEMEKTGESEMDRQNKKRSCAGKKNRYQKVKIDNYNSSYKLIDIGIPQDKSNERDDQRHSAMSSPRVRDASSVAGRSCIYDVRASQASRAWKSEQLSRITVKTHQRSGVSAAMIRQFLEINLWNHIPVFC
ncbi:hypothetical protein ANN_22385 [Periplaneta americana]|uniref:Uncharacterized protein n=1 Tax=Periplaneta americana TaxID=6978 RepID=A0ABQ8S8N0_PERAM|nr:hypothetical protein ANN_22385 [Periplaneta americana]